MTDHFVVSARKYRPATFVSVVGQGHITSTLKNAISRGQLAHAYLFCGPRGVGKTTCARIFAKSINCLNPKDNEACGECESCQAFMQERSFNIHELDAASNNSVEDIRTLTEQVRIPPQIGKYSVYIIDEVHMLSAAAFNAFLKTLEEPPAHAIFILATTEKHKIIPTILSRCQIYDFNRIRVEDAVSYLRYVAGSESVASDDESLHLIARKADGGMRDALSMFDKAVSFCGNDLHFKQVAQTLNVLDYDAYFSVTEMIASGDYPGVLTEFDRVLGLGFSGQTFIAGLGAHMRDMLMCKNPQTLPLLEISGSLLERYKQGAATCDVQFLFDAIAVLTGLEGELKTALNQRLNIELGLMKLCGLGQKKSDGLNEVEAQLPELQKSNITTFATGVATPAAPIAATAAAPAPEPTPAPAATEPVPVASSATATPGPVPVATPGPTSTPTPASEPFPATDPAPTQAPATPAAPAAPATPKPAAQSLSTPLSGQSIASILSSPMRPAQVEADPSQERQVPIDPDSQHKIEKFRDKFLHSLKTERPRIAPAFADMTAEGHVIRINVLSAELHDEIMRGKIEILEMLASTGGISGYLELEVKIVENQGNRKPIKVEDRLKFLTDKNPLITKLRKELEFDIE